MADVPTPENFDPGAVNAAVQAEKAAMLRLAAQGGTALLQQAAAAQQAIAANAQDADPRTQAQAQYFQRLAAQQGAGAQQFNDNLASANSQYMDQVSAAIPITHAQTQRELNSLSAAAQNAQQERMMRKLLQEMQLTETRERIAASREERAAAAANRDRDTALDDRRLDLESRRLDLQERELNSPRNRSEEELFRARGDAYLQIMNEIQGGNAGRGAEALRYALRANDIMSADAILQQITTTGISDVNGGKPIRTPGGKQLNTQYLRDFLQRYYGA
ncbi:MAG TPA: hypothetical protein VD926_15340 [Acidimicrobiales bacterium]|nr:hypothetical protein [Acidimicrobiales bacterium]